MRRSSLPLHRRAVMLLWQVVPLGSILIFLLLSGLPRYAGEWTGIIPPLAIPALCYWSLARPHAVGLLPAFIGGLVQDILAGSPFGSGALVWVSLRYGLLLCRRQVHGQGFAAEWVLTALLLLLTLLLQWLFLSLAAKTGLPLSPLALQWVQGTLCYPALHAAMHECERMFHRRYWHILRITG